MKMPPPPWELSTMLKPSILDGLHEKLLGNRLAPPEPVAHWAPVGFVKVFSRSVVPVGNPASKVGSYGFEGKFTPFASTVIPAPSSAPIRLGSCNSSARLPFRLASQPTVASSGNRSTCGLLAVGLKPNQPDPQEELYPVGVPFCARPNRQ